MILNLIWDMGVADPLLVALWLFILVGTFVGSDHIIIYYDVGLFLQIIILRYFIIALILFIIAIIILKLGRFLTRFLSLDLL